MIKEHTIHCEKHRSTVDPCPVCVEHEKHKKRQADGIAALQAEAERVAALKEPQA